MQANCDIDVDELNDAIDALSKLINGLPDNTANLVSLKEGILAVKKETNPCGLENNNRNNNGNYMNNENERQRSRKRSHGRKRGRKTYRR